MTENGLRATGATVADLGLSQVRKALWNLGPAELTELAIQRGEGYLADSGALAIDTGKFTGRSPKDRFIVKDALTADTIWWGDINIPFEPSRFDKLYRKVSDYLAGKEVFVNDAYACADPGFRLNLRVVSELAYQSLFAHNMFLRLTVDEILAHQPDWTIMVASGFQADPETDGTRQGNFSILNFSKKIILIGGTGYTGEIKKGIFSVLNYLLPQEKKVLSMHCSANIGKAGDTAVFFGLSGTGKTTLSADPERSLIGDDEHGWADDGVFNFEGGCYAKCINLCAEKEPQIFNAIRFGALLENISFQQNSRQVDFDDTGKTENTRVAYPVDYIKNAIIPSKGGHPNNIFLLTADAFGVLPPIAKLTVEQAMYHFISGYTAKVAGTEAGINEPQTTFSACFGKAFLPLHPGKYAELLGSQLRKHKVNVWLVNTGWTGGPYGLGARMKLNYTRAMISAALQGRLENVDYESHPIFGVMVPESCPPVPSEVLNPRNTWADKHQYDLKANELAEAFIENFEHYKDGVSKKVLNAAPKILENV